MCDILCQRERFKDRDTEKCVRVCKRDIHTHKQTARVREKKRLRKRKKLQEIKQKLREKRI